MMKAMNAKLNKAYETLREAAIEAMRAKDANSKAKVMLAVKAYDKEKDNYNEWVNAMQSIGVKFNENVLLPIRNYDSRLVIEKALGVK